MIWSGTAWEHSELRRSGAVGAGPPIQGHPSHRLAHVTRAAGGAFLSLALRCVPRAAASLGVRIRALGCPSCCPSPFWEAAVGQLDSLGFPYSASLLWGTPCSPGRPCNPESHRLSLWCQTSSASPASVSLAVNERSIWFLHGLSLPTERGRRRQLIAVLRRRRSVLRSPGCLHGSQGAPQCPETQGLNLSSWLPEAADASPSRCWEEVTGPILSPRGSSG